MGSLSIQQPTLTNTGNFYYDGSSFISANSYTQQIAKGVLISTELEVAYGNRPLVYDSFMYQVSYDGWTSWNPISAETTETPIDAVNNGSVKNSTIIREVVNSTTTIIKQFISYPEILTFKNPMLGLFVTRIDRNVTQLDTIQVNITSRTGFESTPITDQFTIDILNSTGFELIPITDNFNTNITNTSVTFVNIPITDQFTIDIKN